MVSVGHIRLTHLRMQKHIEHEHGERRQRVYQSAVLPKEETRELAERWQKNFVAIAYRKGIIKCEPYEGHVNGKMFSAFIRTHFKDMFRKSANSEGKLFLQDGDPSQNSALAHLAIDSVAESYFKILS